MEYIVKNVGEPPVAMKPSEAIGKYGTIISLALFDESFVTSAIIMDNIGKAKTTITKKYDDEEI